MKLAAAMSVGPGEIDRYLRITVPDLLTWCDDVVCQVDDQEDERSREYLRSLGERVHVHDAQDGSRWAEDEGQLHQRLLDHALTEEPTHILAIDADEIVPDGEMARRKLERYRGSVRCFTLTMTEMWSLDPPLARHDGGWVPHEVAILYRVPPRHLCKIDGRKLASPRVPAVILNEYYRRRRMSLRADILHLGWANPAERERRHQRYRDLDGGRFHQSAHLDSIAWPDEKCDLRPHTIPAVLA